MKLVTIVDHGLGNLHSVQHACKRVGLDSVISSKVSDITNASGLILPGVGAFGDAMDALQEKKLVEPIKDYINAGRPFLAVCLGMQLLFESSEESAGKKGLCIFKGTIRRFPEQFEGLKNRIPQIAWNHIWRPDQARWNRTLLEETKDGELMYFVHSYYVAPADETVVMCKTKYNNFDYCSAVQFRNVSAFQFHPEKSGAEGLKIYRNYKDNILTYGA